MAKSAKTPPKSAARKPKPKAEQQPLAPPSQPSQQQGNFIMLSPEMLQQLLAQVATVQGGGASAELQAAMKDLASIAKSSERTADEFKRQVRRSNATNMDNGDPFSFDSRCDVCKAGKIHEGTTNTKAHPKPPLKHETFFCHGIQREDWLSPLEIELYNSFTEDKEAHNGQWKAVFDQNGSRRRLHVLVPFEGFDARIDLPPLPQILSELLYGETIADPAQSAAIIADLRKRVEKMEREAAEREAATA